MSAESTHTPGHSADEDVVAPTEVPAARPWPWRGRRTRRLKPFTRGERALMTFFYVVSILMVLAIVIVGALSLAQLASGSGPG